MKLLWPILEPKFANIAPTAAVASSTTARLIRRVPLEWTAPAPPPAVKWARQGAEILETAAISYEWVGDRLRHAGTALHAFLETIARDGVDRWDEAAVRARRPAYRAMLANLGLSPADLDETTKLVENGILRTLRDARGRWILEGHDEAESEFPITGLIDGKIFEAVIDRTFIDENDTRWIIDYKTGEHSGGDLETFLENERKRYEEQLGRYARLMSQRDQRPVRLGLYFPLLSAWLEWGADVVMRRQGTLFDL